jgi:rhamnose transport system ATP-binding protein
MSSPAGAETHVRLVDLSKRFGGVHALRNVSVDIERGTVHALVGENGAGKSTLGKVIAGIHVPDAGELCVAGDPVRFHSARDALQSGITTIAQELPLAPNMTVRENVFLGVESARIGVVTEEAMRSRLQSLMDRTGFDLDGSARVGRLRTADQQKVAILAALARDAELIVMDEPTAALSAADAANLLGIVRRLSGMGTTVVYVSHFLDEVLSIADVVTVMRDGQVVRTTRASTETVASLVSGMLGRSLERQFPNVVPPPPDAPVVLEVEGLCQDGLFSDVSFQLKAGEIVGLAGLVGSGRTELARVISGAVRPDAGRIRVNNTNLRARHPADAIARGVALIPDDRKALGLLMGRSIRENVSIPHLRLMSRFRVMKPRRERDLVGNAMENSAMTALDSRIVHTLSGGNQQKTLFARWIADPPRVLIADEPTRGVDVGAKRGIYEVMAHLAQTGVAVVLISNEIEELLGMSHRIMVMCRGALVADLDREDASEDAVMHAAFGGHQPVAAGAQ